MRLFASSAIALVAAFSAAPVAAQSYGAANTSMYQPPATTPDNSRQEPQQKAQKGSVRPSDKALKALSELQDAIKSKDAAAYQAKLPAAQAAVSTNVDRYILAQLQLQRAADTNDAATAMTAMDAMLASGVVQPAEAGPIYKNLGGLRFNAKQYDLAAAALEKRLALEPNDVDSIALLAETRAAQGRSADAVAALQRGMQAQKASGGKIQESWLKRATALAYEGKLANTAEVSRQWVAAYPSPESWRNAIAIYRNMTRPEPEGVLDLLRLESATGALKDPNDYEVYAAAATDQGNYVEALAALNQGAAAKHIDPASAQFSPLFKELKAKPQATEADLAEALKSNPAAPALLRIGDRYYALGNYGKAVETYQAALAKSGADANVVNLHLGMAQARAGNKTDAAAAFNKVSGSYAEIAKFWLLYVQGA